MIKIYNLLLSIFIFIFVLVYHLLLVEGLPPYCKIEIGCYDTIMVAAACCVDEQGKEVSFIHIYSLKSGNLVNY